jgi:hypothetical protein
MFSTVYRVSQKYFYPHLYTSMWAPVVARQISKWYSGSCHVFISMWGVISSAASMIRLGICLCSYYRSTQDSGVKHKSLAWNIRVTTTGAVWRKSVPVPNVTVLWDGEGTSVKKVCGCFVIMTYRNSFVRSLHVLLCLRIRMSDTHLDIPSSFKCLHNRRLTHSITCKTLIHSSLSFTQSNGWQNICCIEIDISITLHTF